MNISIQHYWIPDDRSRGDYLMDLYNVKDQSPEVRPVTVVVVRMRRREVAGSNIPGREVGEAGQQQEPGTGAATAQTDPVPPH